MVDPLKPAGEPTTILGGDASFKGEISFDGAMRVEGRFEGKLSTKGRLSVGKAATVAADMTVGQVNIEGAFNGNVIAAERVELASSAKVTGDIRAPRLVVAEGATLVGTLHISPDALKAAPATTRATAREEEAVGSRR